MNVTNVDKKVDELDVSMRLFLKNILFILDNSMNQKLKIRLSSYLAVGLSVILAPAILMVFSSRVQALLGSFWGAVPVDLVVYIVMIVICIYVVLRETRALFSECLITYVHGYHKLEYHDRLTGLYNRRELEKRLNCLTEKKRINNCALIMIDIDNFKNVNNAIGHKAGDWILVEAGKRILKYHNSNRSMYRIDGDVYVVLVEELVDSNEVKKLSKEIQDKLKIGYKLESSCVYITASTGIAFGKDGSTADDLLVNADIALGEAKESGKNKMLFYREQMHEAVDQRAEIEKYLHTALERDEFELHYQPQLDMKSNRVTGFEALIRWTNPQLGFVEPSKFITIAENTELIIPIGEWVLKNACMFVKKLQQDSQMEFNVAVNISVVQLLQEDFLDMVFDMLESVQLAPEHLELEITETILMESGSVMEEKLKLLREKGVKIALDDFGKGYSSLSYLKNLPITSLKIDKSFVDTISKQQNHNFLIDIIVKIGENMNLSVVAEGVEIQEQMDYLKRCNCNKMQGYLFSKAVPEREAMKIALGTLGANKQL